MRSYNILVVEDDIAISESIGIYLKNSNYNVFYAKDGIDCLLIFEKEKIDLILMDLMMPNMSGEETIIKLREKSYVPIIILSAKSENYDKIIGLDIGADDYITKPFNPLELLARVNSNIRRFYNFNKNESKDKNIIRIGGIELNTMSKDIKIDGRKISLTSIEYGILELLMKNINRVFSVEQIYEHVWDEPAIDSKTVTVHIRRIREKIEIDPKNPRYLQVSWGLGYKFVNPMKGE
ncbi:MULTISPECIES: response regulator transcription factor [Helcococcus]|uniref:Response regulator transcription factor n=1 Tax=Helcococcus bovis TaxID=3153252 RepID=A0ABW9F914_9FIRM